MIMHMIELLIAGIAALNFGVWMDNLNAGAFMFSISVLAIMLVKTAKL